MKTVKISDLMDSSGVKFGTSGARGLVTDMTDAVCYAYTLGFLQYLEAEGRLRGVRRVAIAGDLRPSTDRIMAATARAVTDRGYAPINGSKVPSPTVALYGIEEGIPAIMVTGSHIPDDRNGIKYNTPVGEVLKKDEAGIKEQQVTLPDDFDRQGMFKNPGQRIQEINEARERYLARWLAGFPADFLAGKRVGLYEHSAVGRDVLYRVLTGLGAEVDKLGFSDTFIPVDTEAIRPEDVELARQWSWEHSFDAIVSTDGDGDRPLISDEHGNWLRGDVAGILCARYFSADTVITPVNSNTAVEKCGWFKTVQRTRIGSPYVIAGMLGAVEAGAKCVVGYEANGGFLTASPISFDGGKLAPLPTRDPVIVHLGILGLSIQKEVGISRLLEELPQRFTASDRLKSFPTAKSHARIHDLVDGGDAAIETAFDGLGAVASTDTTDGLRVTFDNGDIIHLRPSGNAPELRCYTEADTEERARAVNRRALDVFSA